MQEATRPLNILIVYYSRFGAIKLLAEQIAAGVRQVPNAEPHFLEVPDMPVESLQPGEGERDMEMRRAAIVGQLGAADALIVGGPSYFGSMASPLKRLFEDCATASSPPATDRTRPWHHYLFRDKPGAAFTASATPHGGNEETLHSILTMLMHLGMLVVTPGQQMPILENDIAPYGATTITGASGNRKPEELDVESARQLGQRVAEIAMWLAWGKQEWEKRHGAATSLYPSADERRASHSGKGR
jgi:NAD(P)H dehydrogenase (quinone)